MYGGSLPPIHQRTVNIKVIVVRAVKEVMIQNPALETVTIELCIVFSFSLCGSRELHGYLCIVYDSMLQSNIFIIDEGQDALQIFLEHCVF